MQNVKISYAQNREDIILESMLLDVQGGFYVDVGANDPDRDSVTKRFYMNGWRGINIEPNQLLYERLVHKRPRDINLQIGIGAKSGKLLFREYIRADGLSTFSEKTKQQLEIRGLRHNDYEVDVRTLKEIFDEYQVGTIDFLKIDVEGFEWEVVNGNDWKKYRPKVICVEVDHLDSLNDWHRFFDEHNYRKLFYDGINEYYIDKQWRGCDGFSYPEAVLALPVVDYQLYEEIQSQKDSIGQLQRELNQARIHIRYLWRLLDKKQHQINVANEEIRQLGRVKNAYRLFRSSINNAIEHRIEALNRPSTIEVRAERPPKISLSPDKSLKDNIASVRQYDLAQNYVRHLINPEKDRLKYKFVRKAYKTIKKIL